MNRGFEMHGDTSSASMRIFDLHCDTLDRLGLHGSTEYAAFAPQDAGVPHARMS
ncbi:MAG: hypothetical protein RR505_04135, partial [Raoultibacter sp.]